MSKFLAPIHTWLFNKIKLHEQLEQNLINTLKANYPKEINELIDNIYNKYDNPLDDSPIELIIDTSNIHGWLQNRISITETRQAELVTTVINRFGNNSLQLILAAYSSQGKACGNDAKKQYDISSAPKIYDALNNYILEGMPCDNANSVRIKDDNLIEWETSNCLHKGFWKSVSGDKKIFYVLRYTWIKSFIESANPVFTYLTTSIQDDGNEPFINKIFLK